MVTNMHICKYVKAQDHSYTHTSSHMFMCSDIIIYTHTYTHKETGMLKLTDGVCVCQVPCMENCNEYDYDLKTGMVYIMSKTKAVYSVSGILSAVFSKATYLKKIYSNSLLNQICNILLLLLFL